MFDFPAYRRAFEAKDVVAWSAFYTDDAEWVEYRHTAPPSAPAIMRGREEITAFMQRIADGGIELSLSDEVVGEERAAFCTWVVLPDGRRIVENVIVHLRDGLIARHVDVEAWDP